MRASPLRMTTSPTFSCGATTTRPVTTTWVSSRFRDCVPPGAATAGAATNRAGATRSALRTNATTTPRRVTSYALPGGPASETVERGLRRDVAVFRIPRTRRRFGVQGVFFHQHGLHRERQDDAAAKDEYAPDNGKARPEHQRQRQAADDAKPSHTQQHQKPASPNASVGLTGYLLDSSAAQTSGGRSRLTGRARRAGLARGLASVRAVAAELRRRPEVPLLPLVRNAPGTRRAGVPRARDRARAPAAARFRSARQARAWSARRRGRRSVRRAPWRARALAAGEAGSSRPWAGTPCPSPWPRAGCTARSIGTRAPGRGSATRPAFPCP